MATNPDELLIFKLRGMKAKKAEVKVVEEPKPEIKIEQPKAISQPKQVEMPKPAPVVQKVEQTVKKPEETFQNKSYFNMFSGQSAQKEVAAPTQKERLDEQALMQSVMKSSQPVSTAAQTQEESGPVLGKKGIITKAEQMEAAKNLKCVNHPWRDAYALSAYSKMPYCYADVVEYSGKFYSVDDIDKVAGKAEMQKRPMNSFIKIASLLFMVNSLLMFYFTLPQLSFILGYSAGLTPANVLGNLNTDYSIPLFNLLMSIFGFLAGILILLTEERGIYLAGLVGTIILMGASFEYLDSSQAYLLSVSILALVEIVFLAYGRVSATTTAYSRDIVAPDIEWPRVETF